LIPCLVLFLAILAIAALLTWTQVGIHGPNARATSAFNSLDSNSTATWEMFQSSYVFKPKNATFDRALVFIPEYKVDPKAYTPMAKDLAERGYLVSLVQPPLNFPPFVYGRVKDLVDHYGGSNIRFAIGGHGVGANTAAAIADTKYVSNVRGLFLVAPLDGVSYDRTDMVVNYIYADFDGWAPANAVDNNRQKLPSATTYVEVKGNHGQFASMVGTFGGDGTPAISEVEQQAFVVDSATDLLKKL
jgi:hypothetical protein